MAPVLGGVQASAQGADPTAQAAAVQVAAAAGGGGLTSAGSVTLSGLAGIQGADVLGHPEVPKPIGADDAAAAPAAGIGKSVNRANEVASGPELKVTFAGINHRDQRLSFGGNQFSAEPPDQALCVGPKHVVEGVNGAMRVFDKKGAPASATVSFNEFFNYPPAIDRTTGLFGAFITDPVCHYDGDTGRYFLVVLTLDQETVSGEFTGKNRLDIAVSKTSDPTGDWTLYKLPVQNDGTEGTPNHHCDGEAAPLPQRTSPTACIGDYPHIGADKYGIFLTTNEYSFFSDGSNGGAGYTGSQIYAISKKQLANGTATPKMVLFANPNLGPFRSFTVWPAISPTGQASSAADGTEYFLSSTLGDGSETGNTAPSEDRIGVWAVTNTASLNSSKPALKLQNRLVKADTYAFPPQATQKKGVAPLRDCLNDDEDTFGPGIGCWGIFLNAQPPTEVLSNLDSGDTRMQEVVYSNGALWGSLGTAVQVDGKTQAGVLWMSVKPKVSDGKLSASVNRTGYVALDDNDVTYPAIGVSTSGVVVMAATVSGKDHYPSAAYAILSASHPTVKVISEGVGPQDGFSGYPSLGGGRPRWGDYGAVAMDGKTLWLASESIEQSCNLGQYVADFGSCGGTRSLFANWGTRITAIRI